jgi:hypothetical protein
MLRFATDQAKTMAPTLEYGQPVVEIPVHDVPHAQRYFADVFGFDIGWLQPDAGLGSVARGDAVMFF